MRSLHPSSLTMQRVAKMYVYCWSSKAGASIYSTSDWLILLLLLERKVAIAPKVRECAILNAGRSRCFEMSFGSEIGQSAQRLILQSCWEKHHQVTVKRRFFTCNKASCFSSCLWWLTLERSKKDRCAGFSGFMHLSKQRSHSWSCAQLVISKQR